MTFQERTPTQRKAMRMIVLTVVNFLIAFVPYHIHRFFFIIQHEDMSRSESERQMMHLGNRITSALTCISGVLDPVMYFFLARNYQETLLRLCGRNLNDEQSTAWSGEKSSTLLTTRHNENQYLLNTRLKWN